MTTHKPHPPEGDEEGVEIDGLDGLHAAPRRSSASSGEKGSPKESLVQRIGLTGVLGGVAALITAIAALVSAFNSRNGHAPDASPAVGAYIFHISDYWYGTPVNTGQPLIFHLMANEFSAPRTGTTDTVITAVQGTVRNPCQSDTVLRIDSGTWDGNHLIVHVTSTGSGQPLTLDAYREADALTGTVHQGDRDEQILLRRGETGCSR